MLPRNGKRVKELATPLRSITLALIPTLPSGRARGFPPIS
jgi:hypothetical protein